MWFTKKLVVPESNETKIVDCVQLWEVKWLGRDGPYHSDLNKECEVFTSQAVAAQFKQSLENAFRLIRHTSDTTVTMRKHN